MYAMSDDLILTGFLCNRTANSDHKAHIGRTLEYLKQNNSAQRMIHMEQVRLNTHPLVNGWTVRKHI